MTMIEVATIEPAKDDQKMAAIMTTGGEKYKVWPDKLAAYKVGHTYEIEFEQNEFKGKPWRKITKAKPATNSNVVQHPSSPDQVRGPEKATTSDDERQFIRDMLSVGLRTGAVAFSAHDLKTAIAMLRTVWRELA